MMTRTVPSMVPRNNDLPISWFPCRTLLAAQLCEAYLVENGRLEAARRATIHRRPGRLEIFALQHRAGGATVDIEVSAGEGRVQIFHWIEVFDRHGFRDRRRRQDQQHRGYRKAFHCLASLLV